MILISIVMLRFMIGIPFSKMLLRQVSQNIVIGNLKNSITTQMIASLFIISVIILFAYLSTGKIKKFTPMDAIRSGNNGERFKKKQIFKLSRSRMTTTTFLACNDVLSVLKKYIIVLITSVIGIWLIVMPINTINTLRSENIIDMFSIQPCDVWIADDVAITDLFVAGKRQAYFDYFNNIEDTLSQHGIPVERTFMEGMFSFRIRKGDYIFISNAVQGFNTDITKYVYDKGTAPVYANEIALAYGTADQIDAKLGDTVYITKNNEEKAYIVTAFYQSLSNMEKGMRFHNDSELDYRAASRASSVEVVYSGEVSKEELFLL